MNPSWEFSVKEYWMPQRSGILICEEPTEPPSALSQLIYQMLREGNQLTLRTVYEDRIGE